MVSSKMAEKKGKEAAITERRRCWSSPKSGDHTRSTGKPLVLTIVGERELSRGAALRNVALTTYLPSRMGKMLDPRFDPILGGRSGYKVEDQPVVYVTVGRTTREAVRTQEQLESTIEKVEWERRSKQR